MSKVTRKLVTCLALSEKWARGVEPLRAAVFKLQGENSNLLTPSHADFVLCCLKSRMYTVALPYIDTPVYEIAPKENGLEPIDYLSYFYYAGLVYVGLKKLPRALECFQAVRPRTLFR